jgi:hypothetical protein
VGDRTAAIAAFSPTGLRRRRLAKQRSVALDTAEGEHDSGADFEI